jgi:ankyrin repeat protein
MGNHQVKLFTAAHAGHLQEVENMIRHHSVEVNVVDHDGRTALMVAADAGQLKVVQFLVTEGKADINHKDHVSVAECFWQFSSAKALFTRFL